MACRGPPVLLIGQTGVGKTLCGTVYVWAAGEHGTTVNERDAPTIEARVHWTLGVYSDRLRNPYQAAEHLPNLNLKGAPAQAQIAATPRNSVTRRSI